jgi:molybdopterin synthase sulfur carrier subunit
MINVLFFGPVAERLGASHLQVAFRAGMCVQDLRAQLQASHPEAFALVSLAAVDGEHVRDWSLALGDGSEVVFMSKFSGG